MWLNYHHLYYFFRVAQEGNLTEAAKKLRVSQSAVTIQIQHLSKDLGIALFEKSGRKLVLTAEGRRVFEYAESIFKLGGDLMGSLKEGKIPRSRQIHLGATGGLSKNFQVQLIEPLLHDSELQMQIVVGDLQGLLERLQDFKLDLVVSHIAPPIEIQKSLRVSEIGRSPYVLARHRKMKWKEGVGVHPLLVSVSGSGAHFQISKTLDSSYRIQAMVEDVALLRSMVLRANAVVFVPKVALKAEIESRQVVIIKEFKHQVESFYAIERIGQRTSEVLERAIEGLRDVTYIK